MSNVNPLVVDLTPAAEINNMVGNLFNQDWLKIGSQGKIIQAEVDEMHENILFGNIAGMQDDTADILFTLVGQIFRSGVWNNFDFDWKAVCESQWSKFDRSEEEWQLTKAKYDAIGFEVVGDTRIDGQGNVWWVTLSAKDQLDEKGRMSAKGKWVKSHRFVEPSMSVLEFGVAGKGFEYTALRDAVGAFIGDTELSEEAVTAGINEMYITNLHAALTQKWTHESRSMVIVDMDGTKIIPNFTPDAVSFTAKTVVKYADKDGNERVYKNSFTV